MTYTTCFRIFTTRAIVTPSRLDRFPTGKRLEQLTHQRRLANIGSVSADTDDEWLDHIQVSRFTRLQDLQDLHENLNNLVNPVYHYLRRRPCGAMFGAFTFNTPRASL